MKNNVTPVYTNEQTKVARPILKDDVGQRMGIALPVSISFNLMVFVALGQLAHSAPALPPVEKPQAPGTIQVVQMPVKAKKPVETPVEPIAPKKITVVEKKREKEEITRRKPEMEQPEVAEQPPVHGPRVVLTPATPTTPTNQPKPETENVETAANPVGGEQQPSGQPAPAQMVPRTIGGAAFTGNPADTLKSEAARESQMAAPRQATSAAEAAVGAATQAMATASTMTVTPPEQPTRGLTPTSGRPVLAGATAGYRPVIATKTPTSAGFVVPTVNGNTRQTVSAANPACTIAAVEAAVGTGATSAMTANVSAVATATGPARNYTLNTGRPGSTVRMSRVSGSLDTRTREIAVADAVNLTDTGTAVAGHSATVAARTGQGTVTAANANLEARNTTGELVETTNGNGTARTATLGNSAGIKGATAGGNASNLTGGSGELNTTVGVPSGSTTVGVNVNLTNGRSLGTAGDGPKANRDGLGGSGTKPVRTGSDTTEMDEEDGKPSFAEGVTEGFHNAQPAKVTFKPTFNLSDELRQSKVRGAVEVKVTIATNGTAEVALTKSSGNTALDNEVLAYVRQYKWATATKDGQPVISTRLLKFRINL